MNTLCRYVLLPALSATLTWGAPAKARAPKKAAPAPPSGKQIVNRIAATVNGRPITANEVRSRMTPFIRELMMLYPKQGPRFEAELVKAKKAVLDDLIERELVLSEFETKGMMFPETHIDEEINRRILYQFNGRRDLLLEGLRASGLTFSDYRESVKKELTVANMRAMRYDRGIPPTPDEIAAEYNSTKSDYRDISQDSISYDKIFIPSVIEDGNQVIPPEQQYAAAVEIRRMLDAKKISFAEAAKRYSADMHAKDGGAWPAIKRRDLAVEFANIVFSIPVGELAGPLLDPAGFTIVRVRGKQLAPAPPLEKIKEQVDDAVRRKQSEKRYREWINRLRDKAVVRTFI